MKCFLNKLWIISFDRLCKFYFVERHSGIKYSIPHWNDSSSKPTTCTVRMRYTSIFSTVVGALAEWQVKQKEIIVVLD